MNDTKQTPPSPDAAREDDLDTQLILLIRRITRCVSVHSRYLSKHSGLTGPQLLLLRHIQRNDNINPSRLAMLTNMSQGTISSILDRLEERQYITRIRSAQDKRHVRVQLTKPGHDACSQKPLLLQPQFLNEFGALKPKGKQNIIQAFDQVAVLMERAIRRDFNISSTDAAALNDELRAYTVDLSNTPPTTAPDSLTADVVDIIEEPISNGNGKYTTRETGAKQ